MWNAKYFKTVIIFRLILVCDFENLVYSEERTDEEIHEIIATVDEPEIGGRTPIDWGKRERELPKHGDPFYSKPSLPVDFLKCGRAYSVDRKGYILFPLSTITERPCEYKFLGSRKNRCTVAIVCRGMISIAPSSPGKVCDKEWFRIYDGTTGFMTGCGNFTFEKKPRYPRNKGTDVYFSLQGKVGNRFCLVFCLEELPPGLKNIGTPTEIVHSKTFKGYKMERDCKCGKRNDVGRVVGGENAFKYEFPWIASIVFNRKKFKRTPWCAGSLINDRYIVSAAHCFAKKNLKPHEIQVLIHHHIMDRWMRNPSDDPDDEKFQNIPGWNFPNATDESENSLRLDIEEIIIHTEFHNFDYDVALLKLKTPLKLKHNKRAAPICLPHLNEYFEFIEYETFMTVAGWGLNHERAPGASRIPQKLDVPFMSHDRCGKRQNPQIRHLCAGYLQGRKDACQGDSGGPLIYKFERGKYMLSGIVSAGSGCARYLQLGMYTDVQEVLQWIYLHTVEDSKWCPR